MAQKILVVEDNANNATLLRDILSVHGYEIIEAGNGEEGVKKAGEEKPDLILMDIQMPVLDGFAAAKMLRANPATKDIKIVGITSYAMKGDKEKVMAAGFDLYVSKPINTRELPKQIKELLAGK